MNRRSFLVIWLPDSRLNGKNAGSALTPLRHNRSPQNLLGVIYRHIGAKLEDARRRACALSFRLPGPGLNRRLEAPIRVIREHGGQERKLSDISERPPGNQLRADVYVASAVTFQATKWVARNEQTQDVDQAKP